MDLRLVEYFVAVVDPGGLTKAANALYVAQPSLSQAIRGLEREVGAELFDRSGRQLALTPAGRRFETSARRVLQDVRLARDKVTAVRELRAGRLHIAAEPSFTVDVLPRLTRRLRERHPGVEIRVSDPGSPAEIVAAVRQGAAEIGLSTLPVKAEALTTRPLWKHRMVVAMTEELARQVPDPVPQHRLTELPLILEPGDNLTGLLANPDHAPGPSEAPIRCVHRQAIWEMVMAGAGAAVLPEGIATQLSGVVLRPTSPEIVREFGLVYRAAQLSPAAVAFLAVAEADGSASPPST